MDGAPVWVVRAEHLPDRRLRFWLELDGQRREVCTLDGVSRCYPVVKKAVRELLRLPDDCFFVSLHIPRPPCVHDGQIVLVTEPERSYRGVVRGWFDSAVLVDPVDPAADGGGLYAPERLTSDIGDQGPGGVPYDTPPSGRSHRTGLWDTRASVQVSVLPGVPSPGPVLPEDPGWVGVPGLVLGGLLSGILVMLAWWGRRRRRRRSR